MENNVCVANKINELKKGYGEDTFLFEGENIECKRYLMPKKMVNFINTVVAGLFDEEENYIPALFDFVFKAACINELTNIKLPKSQNEACHLIYGTNLFNTITNFVGADYINILCCSCRESIDRKIKGQFGPSEILSTELAMLIDQVRQKLEAVELTDAIKGIGGETMDMLGALKNLQFSVKGE